MFVLGMAVLLSAAKTDPEIAVLKKEIAALRESQAAMQKEIAELRAELERVSSAKPSGSGDAEISFDGAPIIGDASAPVTIVEFSDFQCPYCRAYASQTFPQIQKNYIKTGKVKYIFMSFPLESIHGQALLAHEAASCAGDQGKFWEMREKLFASTTLTREQLNFFALSVGVDQPKFEKCFSSGQKAAGVHKEASVGQKIGVQGTPTFLLGYTSGDAKLKIQRAMSGAQPFSAFSEVIDGLSRR